MAPQLHPFPNRSPSRQRENPLYLRKLWNMDTHEGAGISQSTFCHWLQVGETAKPGAIFWSFWRP